jgi:UDP-N-acetylglucosamine--N-acetylmuramyl-(pentapeptide) pyrophosphoryl-undecaprenol N-acetylglucosamine transferase
VTDILRRHCEPLVLLAASSGGHLHEMKLLAPRIVPPGHRAEWLVPAGPLADELAAYDPVHIVHDTPPRDWRAAARDIKPCLRVIRDVAPAAVVSTGAGLALAALGAARSRGVDAHYIESAARTVGPSLTGKLVSTVPGVHLHNQWPTWTSPRWSTTGSVFDGFVGHRSATLGRLDRVVVTLGTQTGFGFRRLVERLLEIIPESADVLWQTGATEVSDLGIAAKPYLHPVEMRTAMREADVVIAHAGIGSALSALEAGRLPVLVPRRKAFGEHVDDHQATLGRAISGLGLAVVREVADIEVRDLKAAAATRVHQQEPSPLLLGGRLAYVPIERERLDRAS